MIIKTELGFCEVLAWFSFSSLVNTERKKNYVLVQQKGKYLILKNVRCKTGDIEEKESLFDTYIFSSDRKNDIEFGTYLQGVQHLYKTIRELDVSNLITHLKVYNQKADTTEFQAIVKYLVNNSLKYELMEYFDPTKNHMESINMIEKYGGDEDEVS